MYIAWAKQFKPVVGTCFVDSIMIVGVLTHCVLKAKEMNMEHSIIQELILYEFKLGHNAVKTTKNIHCTKGENPNDHSYTNQIV